jgi:dTDP-4-dehydrorhamnose reductase
MILITGANGQVGTCFQRIAPDYPTLHFVFAGSDVLDISDERAVKSFFKRNKGIHWVINCAAYTAVDKAEQEMEMARKINVNGPKYLAKACALSNATLIHLSSDYVYHGIQNRAYVETDKVGPKSVYAKTKLAGERAAKQWHPAGTMIIRTSWVYSEFGHNFLKTMLRLGKERSEISVVADQIGTPTYAPDLAIMLLDIIEKVNNGICSKDSLSGIWNYSNEGVASWYDFAQAIFDASKLPCKVFPIETKSYPTPAVRPPFSLLNKSKIKAAFQFEIPHWRTSMMKCLNALSVSI